MKILTDVPFLVPSGNPMSSNPKHKYMGTLVLDNVTHMMENGDDRTRVFLVGGDEVEVELSHEHLMREFRKFQDHFA